MAYLRPSTTASLNSLTDVSLTSPAEGSSLVYRSGSWIDEILSMDIVGLTEDVSPSVANDFVATYDASATANKKVKISNLLSSTLSLTSLSVTDAGGDGSLTYNNGTGVFTYTGPSASEVRAHFSEGAAIDIASGQISLDIAELTSVTAATGDQVAIADASDSDNIKRVAVSSILALADHDALTNFVANEHIDHTSVSITAGAGLTGGGTIAANRTLSVDIPGATDLASPAAADELLIADTSNAGALRKADVQSVVNLAQHDSLSDFVANEHIDHSSVSITAGAGLTGGGDLTSSRSLAVDITGTTDLASPDAADELLIYDTSGTAIRKADVQSVVNLAQHDSLPGFVANEHVDHSGVSITAGAGLTGGGDLTTTRSLAIDINSLTEDVSPSGVNDFVVTYDASAGDHKKVKLDNLPGGGGGGGGIGLGDLSVTDAGGDGSFAYDNTTGVFTYTGPSASEVRAHFTEGGGIDITSGVVSQDIIGLSSVTPVAGDSVAFADASDSNTVRRATVSSIANLADHDALTNFVSNEHIDHTSVSIATAANSGLTGGGTIASTRNLSVDITGTTDLASPATGDELLLYDISGTALRKADVASVVNLADHDALTNFVANEHIDHSSVSITAGTGLTGGGTIAANRTLSIDINGLTADATPDSAADYVVTYDASAATHKKVLLSNIGGGSTFGDNTMRRELASYLHLLNLAGGAFYRTPSGGFVDGYATNPGGIDTAGSTNEVYGTKTWGNVQQASDTFNVGSFVRSVGATVTATCRSVIPASLISTSGTSIRITLQRASGTNYVFTNCFIAEQAASGDPYDFNGAATAVPFSGVNSGTVPAGGTLVSDVFSFTIDETKNYVLGFYSSTGGSDTLDVRTATGGAWYFKAANDAGTSNVTGYTLGDNNGVAMVSKIEVFSGYSDLTLVSNAFSVSSAPTQAHMLGIVDWGGASPTLNTHLIAAVSRNNGADWSNVTLTNRGVIQGTRNILDGVVDVSGQPSGTQLKTRWTTSGGTQFTLYGTALEV